ncbi:TnpV protein [Lachnospiraceae bacterium KK002]
MNTYLDDINEQATEQMLLLIKQMAEREGVTEQLKAQDQMLWVQRMNNIRDRAIEIVNHSLIYA